MKMLLLGILIGAGMATAVMFYLRPSAQPAIADVIKAAAANDKTVIDTLVKAPINLVAKRGEARAQEYFTSHPELLSAEVLAAPVTVTTTNINLLYLEMRAAHADFVDLKLDTLAERHLTVKAKGNFLKRFFTNVIQRPLEYAACAGVGALAYAVLR